jgi:Flp pilus assembly pilin Flp
MLSYFRRRNGQSTAEYAILIGLIVAAAIAVQIYVKRGVQARFKDASDDYVKGVSGSSDWAAISAKVVTSQNQWESDKLSSKSTQTVLQDKQDYTLAEGGTVG